MKTTFAKLTAVTALALLPLGAFAETPISEVNVHANLNEYVDANAMQYYPQLATDVQRLIAERLDLTGDAGDPMIDVEIKGVLLDGDSVLPDSAEFNELRATINYTDDNNEINAEAMPLWIKASTADTTPQEGVIFVAPDRTDFYVAMITTLANTVVDNIPDIARGDKSK